MWLVIVNVLLFLSLVFLGPEAGFEYIALPLIGLLVRLVLLVHDVLDWCLAAVVFLVGGFLVLVVTLVHLVVTLVLELEPLAWDALILCLRHSLAL